MLGQFCRISNKLKRKGPSLELSDFKIQPAFPERERASEREPKRVHALECTREKREKARERVALSALSICEEVKMYGRQLDLGLKFICNNWQLGNPGKLT